MIIFFCFSFYNIQTGKQNTYAPQNESCVDSFVMCYSSSYLHCKWATLEELEKDPRIHQKIKRFRTKQAQMKHLFTEVTVNIIHCLLIQQSRYQSHFAHHKENVNMMVYNEWATLSDNSQHVHPVVLQSVESPIKVKRLTPTFCNQGNITSWERTLSVFIVGFYQSFSGQMLRGKG